MTKGRIYFLIFIVFLLSGLIVFRLYYFQIRKHDVYENLAYGQHFMKQEILPRRGDIFLRENNEYYPLATNRMLLTVIVNPNEIKSEERYETAHKLNEILKVDVNEVLGKISKSDDNYEIIKRKISDEEKDRIIKGELGGFIFRRKIGGFIQMMKWLLRLLDLWGTMRRA